MLQEGELGWDDVQTVAELYAGCNKVCILGQITPLGRTAIELMVRMSEGLPENPEHPGYKAVEWHKKTLAKTSA